MIKPIYVAPVVHIVNIALERGFAVSADDNFEQPEYGGADNL